MPMTLYKISNNSVLLLGIKHHLVENNFIFFRKKKT